MRDPTAPGLPLDRAAHLFHLLADPVRLRIVYLLLESGELHVGAVSAATGLSPSSISNHLALLRRAGVLDRRRDGQRTYYRVESELVVALLQRAGGEWDAAQDDEV
jgi:DNA-binding transcriptional ArsR family regulator